jgi:hypothetical protein
MPGTAQRRRADDWKQMKKIRIRHREDHQMYLGESGWTHNYANARTFNSALEAITFVIHVPIGNAELIAETFDPTDAEIAVAV